MATQQRFPTGNSTPTDWTANGDTTVWECVDEASADDDTTYASRAASFARHVMTYTAFSISSSAISDVTVRSRVRAVVGGLGSMFSPSITVTGDQFIFGTLQTPTTSYANYTDTWATNPKTGSAWTEVDVEGTGSNPLTEVGIRASSMDAAETLRCTQISIEVNYTAAAGRTTKNTRSAPLGLEIGMNWRGEI